MADTSLIESYLRAPMPNLNWARRMGIRAQAYYDLVPYPVFGFQEWKTENRGPLPKCMPFVSNIVRRSAKWLFGKPPRITCTNPKVDETILKAFKVLYPKLKKAATMSLIEGSVTLRFSFNTATKSCYFSCLSTLDNVRFVYDPHDEDKVILAFVQYPIYNKDSKKWEMYREAWTEDTYAVFKPVEIVFMPIKFGENMYYGNVSFIPSQNGGYNTAESFEGWEIDETKTGSNPLGFIPVIQIRNEEGDTAYGEGILWRVPPIVDRVNLAYHLMDRSNQFDSDPMLVFIDADLEPLDINSMVPGSVQAINTRETADGGNRQAKANLVEPSGRLRGFMSDYVGDLRSQIADLTGTVEITSKEVSNKGNFTQSVLNQIYAPLIESTDARRSIWEAKIEAFLAQCSSATSKFLNTGWTDNDAFNLEWPSYFIIPEQDKGLLLNRLVQQEGLGLITKDRVIKTLAIADGINDVDEFIEELENYEPVISPPVEDTPLEPVSDAPKEKPLSSSQSKEKSKSDKIIP